MWWKKKDQVEQLLTQLETAEPAARREIQPLLIKSLEERGDPEAIQHLIDMLGKWDWDTQHHAAMALKNIGVPVIEPLMNTFHQQNYTVRSHGVEILEHNLRNNFKNLCKHVEIHEEEEKPVC